jgi:hypothetical protein
MLTFKEFLVWEQLSQDTIDVKRIYIDMADDLVAGILLSQIVYWFLPNKAGATKLRVEHDGVLWLAKGREDWYDECRITAKQFDRASKILIEKGLIEKKTFKFNGNPTVHVRLNEDNFLASLYSFMGIETEGKNDIDQTVKTEEPASNLVIPQRVKTKSTKEEERNLPKGEIFNIDYSTDYNKEKNDDDDKYIKQESIFHREIIEECQAREIPEEEVQELLKEVGAMQFTLEALDNTFDKVMPKYERGEVSTFGKYFAQVLRREQRRLGYAKQQKAKKMQNIAQFEDFKPYNWLEDEQ